MSITQQHVLDAHRARQRNEPAPPAPGTYDRQALRERGRSRAVPAGRPARVLFRPSRRTGSGATG
ncbi:hypothetical protein [Streptomyces sp. enrichment culture]|uniref:hypothetical protein n=1 Tax=Streptomyces sp. enrichment culture TaxID=1795815 RepID=UPI003F5757EB